MNLRPQVTRADEAYITRRIIDCCLRENLHGLIDAGAWAEPDKAGLDAWPHPLPSRWWRTRLPGGTLWLPAEQRDYMQSVGAASHAWLVRDDEGMHYEEGVRSWLHRLARGQDEDTVTLHHQYADEAECAIVHRNLAREGYAINSASLECLFDQADPFERALRCDQLASYLDHPYYPTARAKSGFAESDLRDYAPEFAPTFALRWLAVPRASLTLTTRQPAFWPSMVQVGLPHALESSHQLLPVHPLTWERLDNFECPQDSVRAPMAWLMVRPTLSVRTVAPLEHPRTHIKLPLLMRTLGALNLRLIKPSTLYDGHWFEQVLRHIERTDQSLHGRYVHVDESHGGHVAQARHLAYIVRGYPALSADDTLLPVAALCASMPDGRPLALHLADRFHAGDVLDWWRSYVALLCDVHLRLWLVHGIALESNQQNAVLRYRAHGAPTLLMKDNDAARVWMDRLHTRHPLLRDLGLPHDERIQVAGDDALARMFCTITLQLCLLAVLEGVAAHAPSWRQPFYAVLTGTMEESLARLDADGVDTSPAHRLLDAENLPVKYLLSAGSLLSKQATGASDINKFYGDTGPNFMRNRILRGENG